MCRLITYEVNNGLKSGQLESQLDDQKHAGIIREPILH